MNARRLLALVLALSLVVSALPAMAGPGAGVPTSPNTALRGSIDRALQATPSRARAASGTPRAKQANGVAAGGGGSHMVMMLLGLAASVATTYLVMKELKKQQPAPAPSQVP
jgi:hypothetical protein